MDLVKLWDKNQNIEKSKFDMKKLDLTQIDLNIYEPLQSLEVMGVDKADPYKWNMKSADFTCPTPSLMKPVV